MPHKPVLLQEVLQCLNLKPGAFVADGTVGSGGHALEILKAIGPGGRLIGVDQDPAAISRCRDLLKSFPQASLHTGNFLCLDKMLEGLNIHSVDAVLLDVGLSSDQLQEPARGFSFDAEGPLDMRMDPEAAVSARQLVNRLSEGELEKMFREYGQERWAKRFAHGIVNERRVKPLETTGDLARVISKSLPGGFHASKKARRPSWARRHPATRVFQALRIAVNDELGVLERGLPAIWSRIKPGGRFAVITFHSLEDRIVKNCFRDWSRKGEGRLVTKKPVTPSPEERMGNPRSRSAKLRAIEKLSGSDPARVPD